jgi:cytochrome c oxidase assembly protein Cox11
MNPFVRLTIRLVIIFAIIFVAIQPYNWFCGITSKCTPFYFSYYLNGREGKFPVNVNFGVRNFRESLEFEAINQNISTFTNRNNTITYRVKNNSNRFIRFRIKLKVMPTFLEKDVTIYQCLCGKEYKLLKGEERILEMKFKVNKRIEEFFKPINGSSPSITILYEVL